MTEQTNADLIAEARVIWEADDLYPDQMIPRLVMALEAAERRAEVLSEAVRQVRGLLEAAEKRAEVAEKDRRYETQQKVKLAAVVEKVRAYLEEGKGAYAPDLLDILATAPSLKEPHEH